MSGLKAHFACREFAKSFLKQHPLGLRPTSSTLLLLLRSLSRARGDTTFHAIHLATGMSKKWGSSVIDTRVRRRIVSIAIREGCLRAARKWLTEETRSYILRERLMLQFAVVGEPHVKPSKIGQQAVFRRPAASVHRDRRLWKFTKKRFWLKKIARKRKKSSFVEGNQCSTNHLTSP